MNSEHLNNIQFHYHTKPQDEILEDLYKQWIAEIIIEEKDEPGMLNFILCSDEELYKMNVEYLQHDTLTDIITFDYSADFENVSGDIFISIDRVADNARDFGVSFMRELSRIIAHGVLHIIGYKDKTTDERNVMQQKEDYYLGKLSL